MIKHCHLKKLLFVSLFFLTYDYSFGQREVLFEQYVQNPMAINPAFTGARETFNMTAMFRRKWFNIQNSPSSQTFAADGSFGNGKFGAGFQALNDQTSYFTTTALSASFAYHLGISDVWKLSFGGQGGINVLPVSDFSSRSYNRALGSFGVGAWLRSEQFYFGVSKPEVLSHSFGDQVIGAFYRRPLYIMTGGSYDLAEDIMLLPHALVVQEKDHKLRLDLGARVWFSEKVGIGASYRMGGGANAFSNSGINFLQISGEVQVGKNVRLGYFYNSKQVEQIFTTYTGPQGVHELMLKFVPNPNGFQKY
ncbi:PorP/SprF family type IX secretion system membrane protein [Dyadobacter sp. CY312]|uniref:PorP/SprF family type IX secretion system membrane protein n=1 Tax=Dyadobacter sp. CY312 TaxID=2907303 RepID=UPI001F3519EC|nr:PorP/SprF family type IX secretion system membrane protein [Dyadobacter sp. CY312]MCE7041636.1 PorP/SprF family type IX secretion system membrane protein [Dyadobacter sp. CY312]